jgi:hypothetical protein
MPKRPNPFLPAARRAARVVRQVRADDNDNPHRHRALQATGITSLNGIAVALKARGVQTPAGRNCWHATQVRCAPFATDRANAMLPSSNIASPNGSRVL